MVHGVAEQVLLRAVEMMPTIPADSLPPVGTFYSAQHAPGTAQPWPPLPVNSRQVPVWDLGDGVFLMADEQVDYSEAPLSLMSLSMASGMRASPDGLTPPPGGTFYSDSFNFTPDYGTNLWLAITNLANNAAGLFISNTVPDIQYEVQYTPDLLQPWQSAGWFVFGSELTNWTPFSVPAFSPTNLFLRVRSWQDDGSGLPLWWQAEYFGTNGVDPYGDPMCDGWNNLQKFQNGMNPNVFYTPPAPQGVTVLNNMAANRTTIQWQPSPGQVLSYTVVRNVGYWSGGNSEVTNVSANATSYQDDISGIYPDTFNGGDTYDVSYCVQAQYAGGASAWSASVPLQQATMSGAIVPGAEGTTFLLVSGLSKTATAVRLVYYDLLASENFSDTSFNTYRDIPVSAFTNGTTTLPSALQSLGEDAYGYLIYPNMVQSVDANGNVSAPNLINFNEFGQPFNDGRVQLKQNLIFLLRSATADSPFGYLGINPETGDIYTFVNPSDYVYAGFYQLDEIPNGNYSSSEEDTGSFDPYWPFECNYRYRNFVLSSTNLDANGRTTTGAGGKYGLWGLTLTEPPMFQFQTPIVNGATIPALLATNNTRWLASYALDSDYSYLWKIGATNSEGVNGLFNNVRNWYGLPFLSANISGTTTLYAGNTTTASGYFYPETAQPQLQTVEYDFWNRSPVPGNSLFSTTNTSDLLIAPVGSSITVNGYAKLAVLNGYSGVYGYLGQYFTTNAYALDSGGNITTNTTGILSPYGNFFATEPGAASLVTMPDIDTGQQGTSTVYCVSLNVDKNHDGVMDLSFNGEDATSQSSPMEFWVNSGWDDQNGVDRPNYGNTNYMDAMINWPRDLENFARLWVCGMPALPSAQGYTVTLSWQNVSGNPAINLFRSVETNGGIGYLTDTNVAAAQTVFAYPNGAGLIFGQVRSDAPASFPADFFTNNANKYFLFEGAGVGSGELTMTILQNGNIIAQTGVWLDLHDIKDFYERAVITDNTSGVISNWSSTVQTVQYQTAAISDEDTNLIVFVHGINVDDWHWLDASETVYKRLYWAGYHGKFATVKWPCELLNTWTFLMQDYTVFNDSEISAYKAGAALKTYVDQLHTRFSGYRLHLLVHSQGNSVVSEAIRQGAEFDTYILTQGALPASCYDANAPLNNFLVSYESTWGPTPEWQPMGYHGVYTNFSGQFTGQIVNFYNTNDPVLDDWVTAQGFAKPNTPNTDYHYNGTIGTYEPPFGSIYTVTDPQESRACVSRSRTLPIGQSGPETAHGVIQSGVDLHVRFGFNKAFPDDHSAQWTWPIQTTRPYFQQVLTSCQIIPAP
jgi:hypothetical protein